MTRRDEITPLPSDQDGSGRSLAGDEIAAVTEAIRQGTLTTTRGRFARKLEELFSTRFGAQYAYACSSGSAAIHAAIAAIDPEPGDEIITTPITDMGAVTPILYQGAIPVFADIDSETGAVTAATIERRLSDRTRAIIVTHLFGNPCSMDAIRIVAANANVPIIEDCAQALLARWKGQLVGSLGAIGCFSFQQSKHITSGEGGLVITSDPKLASRINRFINKGWDYSEVVSDHYFLALNYRMSELQSAILCAQFPKVDRYLSQRIASAERLTENLQGVPGLRLPFAAPGNTHAYWKYAMRVDAGVIEGGVDTITAALREDGVVAQPRYFSKPAFLCQTFQQQRTFGSSRYPFTLARSEAVDYHPSRYPGVYEAMEGRLALSWNERYTNEHVDYIAGRIREAVFANVRLPPSTP
ncbi:MAG: perosamine synthetase [Thermoanaerobaculia bacterium]|jgi:dTDP-4-amino-4,6-dideoxygalactose transaminase|nr:perosamine synthetase [Thermoanaerobaculia bacterium]